MKLFFWLMVAVNVIFFAVMKSGVLDNTQASQAPSPMQAEKITLMSANALQQSAVPVMPPVSLPLSAVPATRPALPSLSAPVTENICFEWGEFAGADIDRVTNGLKSLQLGDKLSQHEIDRAIGFWVYIAPLKGKVAVSQKVAQLKARGVAEYFVVQDAGEWFNAISLGVFKTRDSAQNFLDDLHAKGIRTAQIGERSGKTKAVVFEIGNVTAQMSDKLTVMQKDFAGSELKRVSCH